VNASDRCHLAGPNGAGKTTLLRAIMGELPLAHGERRVGPSVTFGLIDQRRDFSKPPIEHVEAETGATLQDCRSTLAKFGLTADHVHRSPDELSPGERTRTLLAAFQLRGVNTVVLDEPTNHLDIEAIEQLESALERFHGTLIVVTHDRAFLENIAIDRTVNVN
jgi:ATPase subunit of ABC transporter with duplicated ATPase domains